jgi:recombination protein RecT
MTQANGTAVSTISEIRQGLAARTKAFKAQLPAHIPVEKFQSAALTAIQQNPDLEKAEPQSLWNALTKCAGDGLIPDNREATVQIYNTKVGNTWVKKAQYMPMVYGVIKRMRNSGEISTVEAFIVYENDHFDYQLGDEPKLVHKPLLKGARGEPVLVYAIVNFKDGAKYREIMTIEEVNKARDQSKSYKYNDGQINPNSPWTKFWGEMAKKTVIHRAAKRLPASADLEKFLQSDMRIMLNPEEEHKPANGTAVNAKTESVADNLADIEQDAAHEEPHVEGELIEAERVPDIPVDDSDLFPGDRPSRQ